MDVLEDVTGGMAVIFFHTRLGASVGGADRLMLTILNKWMDRLKNSSQSDFEGEDRAPTVSFFSFPGKGALAYPLFPPASISVPTDHCTV